MKVIIAQFDMSGLHGCKVYCNGRAISNKHGGMWPYDFSEQDLYELLGEHEYNKFLDGKFVFELTKRQIFDATNDINFFTK